MVSLNVGSGRRVGLALVRRRLLWSGHIRKRLLLLELNLKWIFFFASAEKSFFGLNWLGLNIKTGGTSTSSSGSSSSSGSKHHSYVIWSQMFVFKANKPNFFAKNTARQFSGLFFLNHLNLCDAEAKHRDSQVRTTPSCSKPANTGLQKPRGYHRIMANAHCYFILVNEEDSYIFGISFLMPLRQ